MLAANVLRIFRKCDTNGSGTYTLTKSCNIFSFFYQRILAFEELWEGGTWIGSHYQEDGIFIGKYGKDFKYNDNVDIFWNVEIGLNGSTLEFCSMRDQEYADTSRTKEACDSLLIDIQ